MTSKIGPREAALRAQREVQSKKVKPVKAPKKKKKLVPRVGNDPT